ncbi:MAG TPA: hypothetical protein VE033_15240, partial [Acetobacteraceae bacterium]|nr:hypothetical protein [Acetobacteraceae bacterium]
LEVTPGTSPLLLGAEFPAAAWSPSLRAQAVLAEFAAEDWRSIRPAAPNDDEDQMQNEVRALLGRVKQRPGRMREILDQADALDRYWLHMLMAGNAARPATTTLVYVGIAVGHMVGMYWKWHFRRARPVQVYPALVPAIPTPAHASYPSNHALQSQLVRRALDQVFEQALGNRLPALEALADRIAENREVAGVHFQSDTTGTCRFAGPLFEVLAAVQPFKELVEEAASEWKGLRLGAAPGMVEP